MMNIQSLGVRFLLLITGGLTQCLALKQITVMQGHTLTLTCSHKNTNMNDSLEWRNPEGLLLFFNRHKVLKDKRSKFVTLTNSEFTISVTDVTFKDEGVYRCLHYNNRVTTKRYKVIVIGAPKLEIDEQEDKTVVKCSASANDHPPTLSWQMENGLEIEAYPYYEFENASKKYTAVSQLNLRAPKKKITIRCLVRHPALYGSHGESFICLGNQKQETSTLSKISSTTHGSTDSTVSPTLFSSTSFTMSYSESETTDYSNLSTNSEKKPTNQVSETTDNSNITANETTEVIPETTEDTTSNTSIKTSSNTTDNNNINVATKHRSKEKSSLLVLLVTCLIICLFVVLAFFLVRLRKAHIAWKKENEESDQSVESSRSKSSNEEKQKQQQRGQGFWNTSFTKYKPEEKPENAAQSSSASVQVINENPQQFISRSGVKETEL